MWLEQLEMYFVAANIDEKDQLKIEVELVKRKLNLCKFHGTCTVDKTLAVDAIFTANLVDRAEE